MMKDFAKMRALVGGGSGSGGSGGSDGSGGGGGEAWRYIGKAETAEEVTALSMTVDSEGNAFSLKKAIMVVVLTANTGGASSWVRPFLSNKNWNVSDGNLNAAASGTQGALFEYEVIDGKAYCRASLSGINTTSSYTLMQYNKNGYIGAPPINKAIGDAITQIGITGWEATAIGIGSYIEVWGVDA